MAAIAIASVFLWPRGKPLDQLIMAADHLVFIGEATPPEPGDAIFLFLLPEQRPMAMQVRPHTGNGASNAGKPEIWIDRNIGFEARTRLPVKPQSELENKLVGLISRARPVTNHVPHITVSPRPERIEWVLQRVKERQGR